MHVEGFVGNTHRAWSELDWCFIGVLKNLVMLESKLRACRMTLRLERAVQRTNRTEFAAIIEQRIANRTRSSVCRFHNPWLGFLPTPSSANRARVYTEFGWLGIFECGATARGNLESRR
jgi:hypothetical protein